MTQDKLKEYAESIVSATVLDVTNSVQQRSNWDDQTLGALQSGNIVSLLQLLC